ncbi:MAG: DNA-binding response regulator [Paenibacillaceae bacterium]|nr:MAG: DNA-binding response regulator [Paenibacillaceae bacterium]
MKDRPGEGNAMDKTILIVEDEPKLRRVLADFLRNDGFRVLEAGNGEVALQLFDRHPVDLVILDILMPGLDGWATCRRLRERSGVLILFLSAKSEEEDKLLGYELGADDYLTKPFSPRVLTAKIKALFKRLETPAAAAGRKIRVRGLVIDDLSRNVEADGRKIRLTPKEYDLLLYLALNKGILLSREQLLDRDQHDAREAIFFRQPVHVPGEFPVFGEQTGRQVFA